MFRHSVAWHLRIWLHPSADCSDATSNVSSDSSWHVRLSCDRFTDTHPDVCWHVTQHSVALCVVTCCAVTSKRLLLILMKSVCWLCDVMTLLSSVCSTVRQMLLCFIMARYFKQVCLCRWRKIYFSDKPAVVYRKSNVYRYVLRKFFFNFMYFYRFYLLHSSI